MNVHTRAREIVHEQRVTALARGTGPADILATLAREGESKRARDSARARGYITPDTLPEVTSVDMERAFGPLDLADDLDNWKGVGWDLMIDRPDIWCWFNGRPHRRDSARLKAALRHAKRP
jgi:hypothetical protein